MDAAMTALYALLTRAWPAGARLLHPDDKAPWEDALAAGLVVRYYQPTLVKAGTLGEYRAHVDVAHRTPSAAYSQAQALLKLIGTTPRAPNGAFDATATPLKETSYERVHVTFTLLVDTQE